MVYTPETKKEFLNYVDHSKKLYKRIPTHKKTIVKKTLPLMANPLISSYWIESAENPLSWRAFVMRIEGFQEFLQDKFSISIETPPKQIWMEPEYGELERAVSLADLDKLHPTVAHDAYHLLMIKKEREKATTDELGETTYFLTRDYSLARAENIVDRGARIPSSLSVDVWAQMILPFLSPKIVAEESSEAYMKILSSKFPSLIKSVNSSDLIDVMGVWMDDPSITTDVIRKIVGNKFVTERLQELRARPEIESSKVARLIDPIISIAVSSAGKRHEKQAENLKAEHDKEMSQLKKQMQELQDSFERTKRLSKPLFITGISMFVLLVVTALVSAYQRMILPDAFFYAMAFAGIAFVASSVFGVKALEKVKRP